MPRNDNAVIGENIVDFVKHNCKITPITFESSFNEGHKNLFGHDITQTALQSHSQAV